MINLEKERDAFKQKMLKDHCDYKKEQEFEINRYGDFSWIGTDSDFAIWQMCAEEKQKEITELKQKLEKLESGEFALVPKVPTFAMTESGLMTLKKNESEYYIGSVQHIYKAMIEAVEKDNE